MHERSFAPNIILDLTLPPDTILATILRDKESVVPRGNTRLRQGDVAVLAAGRCEKKVQQVQLSELKITPEHKWKGKTLAELKFPSEQLVILIRRGTETVIPQGDTMICEGDVLVMHEE